MSPRVHHPRQVQMIAFHVFSFNGVQLSVFLDTYNSVLFLTMADVDCLLCDHCTVGLTMQLYPLDMLLGILSEV